MTAITTALLAGVAVPALEKSFNPNLILADGTSTLSTWATLLLGTLRAAIAALALRVRAP